MKKNQEKMLKEYEKAVDLFNKEKFKKCIGIFRNLAGNGIDDAPKDGVGAYQYALKTEYENIDEAIDCLEQLCDMDYASAQDLLGQHYCNGIYVEKDYKKAVKLFEQAIEKDWYNAMYNLACCYANGDGVKQDYKKAFELMLKVSTQIDELNVYDGAMFCLAEMYKDGLGTKKDLGRAVDWYTTSAFNNNENAIEALDELYKENKDKLSNAKNYKKWKEKLLDEDFDGEVFDLDDLVEEGKEIFKELLGE